MTSYTRHNAGSSVKLITVLATCLWTVTLIGETASGESQSLAPSDETTLEIPNVASPDSGEESSSDEVGTPDEYEQASKDVSVSYPAQYVNDGSGFDFDARDTRLIGITVDDDIVKREGHWVEGVIIVKVLNNSPAARAGLRGQQAAVQNVLEAGVVVCSVFFPPGFMALPIIEESGIGKSYDLIIAVDGERVRDVLGFDDALEKAEPGEILYLSIIRGSHHWQIPVPIPRGRQTTQ